jgi:hypothetical protein
LSRPPPEDLARRASNRTVVTQGGLANLARYHEQDDPAAYFEAAYTVLTGKTDIVGPEVGWELLGKATRLGDPSAQYFLGLLHIGGALGTPNDYASGLPCVTATTASARRWPSSVPRCRPPWKGPRRRPSTSRANGRRAR